MFKFNGEDGFYEDEINGVRFICDVPDKDTVELAEKISQIYESKLPDIAKTLLEYGLEHFYGNKTVEEIIDALGIPEIDLDGYNISYYEHTLSDDDRVPVVEYNGEMEEFLSASFEE